MALLAASALLHFFVFNLVEGHIGLPAFRNQEQTVITTALLPPVPDKSTIATPEPEAAPKPAPPKKPRPRRPVVPRKPTLQPAPVAVEPEASPAIMEVPTAVMEAPADIAAPQPEAVQPETAQPEATPATAEPSEQTKPEERVVIYKVSPPPSAELKYDVLALRKGEPIYGSGKIKWQTNGSGYAVHGEAGILFFNLLEFDSQGMIDEFGIAPLLYSEKRVKRAQTNTHFHRERNTISFSASTNTYPRKGGEQDRASIIWQLAGIGRGDGENFMPDAELDIFVAGVRDAETWRIRVLGKEDIEVDGVKTAAWHVVRNPRPGSYDQKLDIWLAPDQEWYPVKLRYTETNGDYLELSLSKVSPITSQ